ncbi:Ger(x)C family spore germination protein [Alkalihalobacillus sp. 1P02AB]|uniref:Ger(x)C family spore germination protein n=1 Tax=Alkalihalobacillus sp. 1P02AB TaxID=3132260 RepID=UPI0039A41429
MRKGRETLVILCLICLLSGCWSKTELNEIGIVTAIGIDLIEDEYIISVQILNPSEIAQIASSNQIPVYVYSIKANSILEAIKKMSTIVSREIYIAHTRMVIIGEELAVNGISNILDFFTRYNELRPDFYLVIAKDYRAEEIISVLTPLEKIPANKMYTSMILSERIWAPTRGVKIDELINTILSDGMEPVLTGVTLYKSGKSEGDSESNVKNVNQYEDLQLTPFSVFQQDRLIGWLNEQESKGVNYLNADVISTVGPIDCQEDNRNFTTEVTSAKADVKSKIVSGKPVFFVHISLSAELKETSCRIDPTNRESIKKYEQLMINELRHTLAQTFAAVEHYQSDFLGLGDLLKRQQPSYWEENKQSWQEQLSKLSVEYQLDVSIERIGTTTKPYQFEEIRNGN